MIIETVIRLITVFGVAGNCRSLYYFVSQRKSNTRARNVDTSTLHLFVMLNCFDILVCVSSFLSTFAPDDENVICV